MRSRKYIFITGACCLVSLLIAFEVPVFSAIGQDPDSHVDATRPNGERPGPQRSTSEPKNLLKVQGALIRPIRQASISTEVSGAIKKRNYESGDRVAKGEVVFEISPDEYEIARNRAEQRLMRMRITHQKWLKEQDVR